MRDLKGMIGVAAITLSVIAIATSVLVYFSIQNQLNAITEKPSAQNKEVYLSTVFDASADEKRLLGIPVDEFSQRYIIANREDTVTIHFFSAEKADSDVRHSFDIGAPYNINVTVNPGESKTVSFVASQPGTFEYKCVYHPDIMKGELVVLP